MGKKGRAASWVLLQFPPSRIALRDSAPVALPPPGVTLMVEEILDKALMVGQQYRAGRPSRCGRGRGLPQHRRLSAGIGGRWNTR